MRCLICGAPSAALARQSLPAEFSTRVVRRCDNDHVFEAREVHVTQVVSGREMASALRRIERRVRQYARDSAIAADPRPADEVAADHSITPTRVRQIRRAFRFTSERTEA